METKKGKTKYPTKGFHCYDFKIYDKFCEICRREHVSKSQIFNHIIKKIVEDGTTSIEFNEVK